MAHLFETICLKHSATLILPPLLKPPSRRAYSITISKLIFTAVLIPSYDARTCACVHACVRACVRACVCVCVCVKCPVLPPCAVDGRSRNPLYYYYVTKAKAKLGNSIEMGSFLTRQVTAGREIDRIRSMPTRFERSSFFVSSNL